MRRWQFPLQILWALQEQTLLLASEMKDLNPDQVLRSATCPVSCLGKEWSSNQAPGWYSPGRLKGWSTVSLLSHYCRCCVLTPFFSVKMNFFLLGLSKHSTIWYQSGRKKQVINALPRSTFGLFSLAFTRQQIIKQNFQIVLMLISKPLSSMPEQEDSVLPC